MSKFFISLVLITFVSWQNEGYSSVVVKELEDGSISIKAGQKYPPHIFDTLAFVKDVQEKLSKYHTNTPLSIDLSGDISISSRRVEILLNELNRTSFPINFLNLSGTSVEANIIDLLLKSRIECIDISETEAAESEKLSFEEPCEKFIFIPKSFLYSIKDLDKDTLDFHKKYYGHNDEEDLPQRGLLSGDTPEKTSGPLGIFIPHSSQFCGLSVNYGDSTQGFILPSSAQIFGLTG
ncbi:MAG: hypothetical protein J0H12_07390 [Candidatus Paracaedimonas acanthamoebae]|uniref:Uncharacterized protein n=1 Tax=Candidatus Paracaedimonas acanthamoebae TaxID=244581 RepID=A0A8J7TV15_9PROT|nr:hypothetical protein [Candidatus Paracaedimonas acanthamoebae]